MASVMSSGSPNASGPSCASLAFRIRSWTFWLINRMICCSNEANSVIVASVRAVNTVKRLASSVSTPFRQARQLSLSVLQEWHNNGMNRIRLSTTVDARLLGSARSVRSGITDAALIDEALTALLARYRSAELDASYVAYDEHPAEEPDEWGDLATWRRAAGAS